MPSVTAVTAPAAAARRTTVPLSPATRPPARPPRCHRCDELRGLCLSHRRCHHGCCRCSLRPPQRCTPRCRRPTPAAAVAAVAMRRRLSRAARASVRRCLCGRPAAPPLVYASRASSPEVPPPERLAAASGWPLGLRRRAPATARRGEGREGAAAGARVRPHAARARGRRGVRLGCSHSLG